MTFPSFSLISVSFWTHIFGVVNGWIHQSSFETLSTDSEPGEWINVSFYSPVFILDLFSCIACTFEGFCDLLFVVL